MALLTFIDHVPRVALALVVTCHIGDMILHRCQQGGIGPGAARDFFESASPLAHIRKEKHNPTASRRLKELTPRGQLVMPHEIMTSQQLSVTLGQFGDLIPTGEREDSLLGLRSIPL